MVWLILVSVAAIALIVWANQIVPRSGAPSARAPQPASPPPLEVARPVSPHFAPPTTPVAPMRIQPLIESSAVATRLAAQPIPLATPLVQSAAAAADSKSGVRWIPFGEKVQLRNITIDGGGFYFGHPDHVSQITAGGVDPQLPIDVSSPDWNGEGMPYYPQFHQLGPRQRGAYVAWLHSKRDFTKLGIGYCFLYFYGIERRGLADALVDDAVKAEVPALIREVDRLLSIYGGNNSFRRYAQAFRDLAALANGLQLPEIEDTTSGWTSALRARIGIRMRDQQPLLPQEAFVIARAVTPEAQRDKWELVLPELRSMFEGRFARTYPQGLTVAAPKTQIIVDYQPASPDGRVARRFSLGIPDPAAVTAAYKPLSRLIESAMLDIEPLRKVRRSKNRTPAAELVAMPAELVASNLPGQFGTLRSTLRALLDGKASVPYPLATLLAASGLPAVPLNKRTSTSLVLTLESLGIGGEPDPRFHGVLSGPDGDVELFALTADAPRQPSPAYSTAQLLSQAAIAIAGTGNGIQQSEVDALLAGIERQFALSVPEQARMHAHVQLLHRHPPLFNRIEAKARLLPESDRVAFAAVLVDIAAADGHISPAEVRLLERFYKALGLDAARIHSDLHNATVSAGRPGERPRGHALSADAIAARLAETQRVQSVLSQIFVEDQPSAHASSPSQSASANAPGNALGLAAPYSAVLSALLEHPDPFLPRSLLDGWCELNDVLTEGAIEFINEASFNVANEPLVEGDDPIELNAYAAAELRRAVA